MNIDSYIPGNMDWAFLPANRKSADYEALLDDFLIYNFFIYISILMTPRFKKWGAAFFITTWP